MATLYLYADHLRPMVLLSLNTVQAGNAKSSQTLHIPLNDEAISVLSGWRSMQAAPAALVFPGEDGKPFDNVNKAWSGILFSAGL